MITELIQFKVFTFFDFTERLFIKVYSKVLENAEQ